MRKLSRVCQSVNTCDRPEALTPTEAFVKKYCRVNVTLPFNSTAFGGMTAFCRSPFVDDELKGPTVGPHLRATI